MSACGVVHITSCPSRSEIKTHHINRLCPIKVMLLFSIQEWKLIHAGRNHGQNQISTLIEPSIDLPDDEIVNAVILQSVRHRLCDQDCQRNRYNIVQRRCELDNDDNERHGGSGDTGERRGCSDQRVHAWDDILAMRQDMVGRENDGDILEQQTANASECRTGCQRRYEYPSGDADSARVYRSTPSNGRSNFTYPNVMHANPVRTTTECRIMPIFLRISAGTREQIPV